MEPFRAEHWLEANPALSVEGDVTMRMSPLAIARHHERGGPAWTLRIDGEIASCYGVLIPWAGLGEVWAFITPRGRQHPLMVHRAALRALSCARPLGLRRLHADVRADFAEGQRWIRALGFHLESTMPHYGPRGETFQRFVKYFLERA